MGLLKGMIDCFNSAVTHSPLHGHDGVTPKEYGPKPSGTNESCHLISIF